MGSKVDDLTGLYNADTAREHIIERMENIKPDTTDVFLLMDCDNFQDINETHGHIIGDKVLEHLGNILKKSFRKTDIIGRMGGDEFCVYMKDMSSIEIVEQKCRKINDDLKKALTNVDASVSFGVTLVQHEDTYENVYERAERALYEAKQKRKA
ncbi:MAG: GGDEF domain-containing protein [Caldicoprobacterales bacterium]|jgi:diguanylate cyclase (GGDEF)-like protein|nr:GGDEF domain-containing protein [Clostridiales bacterium]